MSTAPGRGFRPPEAFLRLGLKSNPFNHLDPDELAARIPPRPWIRALARQPWDVLVLHGESGHGKTSAARMIEQLLLGAGEGPARYLRLPERGARWPRAARLEGCRVVIVDSVQRIARWRHRGVRRLVAPGERRLVLCGHVDPTAGQRLEGRIERVVPPPPDVTELVELHGHYLAHALRPGAPPVPPLEAAVADAILRRAGGSRFVVHRLQYLAFERLVDRRAPALQLTVDDIAAVELDGR